MRRNAAKNEMSIFTMTTFLCFCRQQGQQPCQAAFFVSAIYKLTRLKTLTGCRVEIMRRDHKERDEVSSKAEITSRLSWLDAPGDATPVEHGSRLACGV